MSHLVSCPQGHQWQLADDGQTPASAGKVLCPVCGAAVDISGSGETHRTPAMVPAFDYTTIPPPAPTAPPPPNIGCKEETLVEPSLAAAEAGSGELPRVPGTTTPPVGGGPATVAGYEILEEVGRGGMGVVYKANQLRLNRIVALKMILAGAYAGAEEQSRFRKEAETIATLQHPNIIPIFEVGEADGKPFFTMEYVDGGTLDRYLLATPLTPRESALLVQQLADAMQFAHRHNIIHRDLKPANVLLAFSPSPRASADAAIAPEERLNAVPKITDFGLAKRLEGDPFATVPGFMTQTGAILGTPSYMAPEQAAGRTREIGPAVDIYALGAILYELLTGRPPFQAGSPMDTLLLVVSEEPLTPSQLRPKLPRDLETICMKCLQKDPARRYASAGALAEDLQRFLEGEPIQAVPVSNWERLVKWARRRPAVAALVGVCLVATLILVVGGAWKNQQLQTALDQTQAEKVKATEALTVSSQRLTELYLANGIHLMDEGNLFGSLVWLTEVLCKSPEDPDQEDAQRTRLATTLRQCPDLTQVLFHQGSVNQVVFSPLDGRRLATASDDNTAQVWDTATGRPVTPPLKHEHAVKDVGFSRDGQRVVTASADQTARVWDANTGAPLTPPLKHHRAVLVASFSPDGQRVLTASEDHTAQVWDAHTGKPLLAPPLTHEKIIHDAEFSPDGRRVVTASGDHTAQVWDAATGKALLETPLQHRAPVVHAVFSPKGERVLTASLDHTAVVWDTATGRRQFALQNDAPVNWAVFSPQGDRILTASDDMNARVWDAATGRSLIPALRHKSAVLRANFSPDGQWVATASDDNTARVWEAATGTPLTPLLLQNGTVRQAAFCPRPGRLLASASDDDSVRLWDLDRQRAPLFTLRHKAMIWSGQYSPDGRRVLTASADKTAQVWDAATGKPSLPPLRHQGEVRDAAFSPNGQRIATASADETARVWDAATGQPVTPPLQHQGTVVHVVFSPDSRWVATASADNTARIWDAATGQPVTGPLLHQAPVTDVTFNREGDRVATASLDHTAQVWNAATGQPTLAEPLRHRAAVLHVAFSPKGGRKIITASDDKTARVWETATGQLILPVLHHAGPVLDAMFSPVGHRMVTSSEDNTALIWETPSGRLAVPPLKHFGAVRRAVFNPDGRGVLTASDDNTARVWGVSTGQPLTPPLTHPGWGRITDACFSPIQRHVLTTSADGTVRIWKLPTDDRPAEDLALLAQLLAVSRIDERTAGFVPLSTDEVRTIWNQYRAKYPEPVNAMH